MDNPANEIRVALVQWNNQWMDKAHNLAILEEELSGFKGFADLIVLPELFNTGYGKEALALAEPFNLTTHKWMRMMAAKNQAVITGSMVLKENGSLSNACLVVFPDGETKIYRKSHLFSLNWEKEVFRQGKEKLRFQVKGWNVAPFICYDLRFPEWCRNAEPYYDLAVFVAAWPQARIDAWTKLLVARAIENQAYTIGVNQIYLEGSGSNLPGHSLAIDYSGDLIVNMQAEPKVELATLSLNSLHSFRKEYPFLADKE